MSELPTPAVRFERPGPTELRQVGELRWEQVVDDGRHPRVTRRAFVDAFQEWCTTHQTSHLAIVGVGQHAVVAFGFVALTPRVPSPDRAGRRSADVQSVWVAPELRNAGIGGRLIGQLVDLARQHGAEHVTVHASSRAVTAYERAGFTHDPLLLNQAL